MINKQIKFKVISYNIHSGRNLLQLPRLQNMLSLFQEEKPDIIGVQEINENRKRGLQVTAFKDQLKLSAHFGANIPFSDGEYGIATFSRFPILKNNHLLFNNAGEQRGFIDTKIKINKNVHIHVINTHLSLKSIERAASIAIIEDYIAELTNPFIILGDFNTSSLKIAKACDTARIMKKEHQPTLMLSNKRIDYIFISKKLTVLKYDILPVKYSDHYPVVVELIFNNSKI